MTPEQIKFNQPDFCPMEGWDSGMRQLKFRAWDKGTKQMIDTGFHILGEVMLFGLIEDFLIASQNNPERKGILERLNDVEIMQFTGFQDKNGKDIYEGDIVIYNSTRSVVKWIGLERGQPHSFTYALTIPHTPYRNDFQFLTSSEVEVVGNICETPELK